MMPANWSYQDARNKIVRSTADALQRAGGDRERAKRIMMQRFHDGTDQARQRRQSAYIMVVTEALDSVEATADEPTGMSSTLRLAYQSRARSG